MFYYYALVDLIICMPFVTHLFGNLGKRGRKVIPLTRVYKAYKVSTNYGYYGLIGKN